MPRICCEQLSFSCHAMERVAKRNLSVAEIDYALKYGQRIHRTGIVFYFLGERDIPKDDRRNSNIVRLVGLTLLVSQDRELITVYRNRDGLRAIKRKSKYQWSRPACKTVA